MALWRTNGYAKTTVADICRAAGVSRALFYFYFPAKEDVLFEVGLLSTRAAQKTVGDLATKHAITVGDGELPKIVGGAPAAPAAEAPNPNDPNMPPLPPTHPALPGAPGGAPPNPGAIH